MWVATGYDSSNRGVVYSSDGINWSYGTVSGGPYTAIFDAVAYNGSKWVIVGGWNGRAGIPANDELTSTDGINWTLAPAPIQTDMYGNIAEMDTIVWNGSQWFIGQIDNAANIFYSNDAQSWTVEDLTSVFPYYTSYGGFYGGKISSMAWNGSMWVAGAIPPMYSNSLIYSTDGKNWTGSGKSVLVYGAYAVASKHSPNLYPPR